MRLLAMTICVFLLYQITLVTGKGSPILIKSEGKKGKGGKELIMLGGGCSPVLIKNGGDKKKKNQMIIAGGGDCGEKKTVKYVPHYIPYVVHKNHVVHVPKYIYKHHYIRVPHVIVKKIPVPVHVPQYVPIIQKEVHMMYDQYKQRHGHHGHKYG